MNLNNLEACGAPHGGCLASSAAMLTDPVRTDGWCCSLGRASVACAIREVVGSVVGAASAERFAVHIGAMDQPEGRRVVQDFQGDAFSKLGDVNSERAARFDCGCGCRAAAVPPAVGRLSAVALGTKVDSFDLGDAATAFTSVWRADLGWSEYLGIVPCGGTPSRGVSGLAWSYRFDFGLPGTVGYHPFTQFSADERSLGGQVEPMTTYVAMWATTIAMRNPEPLGPAAPEWKPASVPRRPA